MCQSTVDGNSNQTNVNPFLIKFEGLDSKIIDKVDGDQAESKGCFILFRMFGAIYTRMSDYPVGNLIKPGLLTCSPIYLGIRQHPALYTIFRTIGHGGTLKDITILQLSGTGTSQDETKSVVTTKTILKEAKLISIDFLSAVDVAGMAVICNQIEQSSKAFGQKHENPAGTAQQTQFDFESPFNKNAK
jgi:hypothetical protein